jgi:hypothetical protein
MPATDYATATRDQLPRLGTQIAEIQDKISKSSGISPPIFMARQYGTALESSEKQWFSFFPDRLTRRHRQTWVGEFVVACPETFGTACPRADKQWHEAQESVWGGGVRCQ